MTIKNSKILFFMRYPLDENHHLKTKFNGQMQACVNLDAKVFFLGYDSHYVYLVNFNTGKRIPITKTHFRCFSKYRSTFGLLDLYSALSLVLDKFEFKYIYMRTKPINRTGYMAFQEYKKEGGKLIVELPAYNSTEKELSIGRTVVRKVLEKWNKKFTKMIDLYCAIGPDCGGCYNGRPAINIMNGVCLEQLPLREYMPQKELHFLALGSMRIWHAYDRLIEGLALYKGDVPVIIDMVGGDNDGSLAEWKALVNKRHLENKVIFHGPLYGSDLDKMFNVSDIGIATLGLHRNKMPSGSVLKLGEYAARGLPFVYGYSDKIIDGHTEFAYKVPEDDSPLDIDSIIDWALKMKAHPEIATKMRDFARDHMSWEREFESVFDRVERIQ